MALLKELIVLGAARFIGAAYAPKFVTNGGTSSQFVKGDGTLDSTVYLTSQNISGKVDKPSSSTDNAIVRFDGTAGAILNSGVTIDDSNNVSTAGDVKVKNLIVHGSNTSNDTRYWTSDSTTKMYASVGGIPAFVITNTEVRRGASATDVNLGTSSYPWNNAYAKKFITNGGSSSLFVKGDGTLDSNTYITLSTFNTSNQDLAAIEALSGTSGALVKTAANTWSLYTIKNLTAASHSGWSSLSNDAVIIPNMNMITYWNGAYNSSNNSNLAYCNKGAFGTAVTHAHTDYVTNVSWDSTNYKIQQSKGGGTATDVVSLKSFFIGGRGTVSATYVDTTDYTSSNTNFVNLDSGSYYCQRSGSSDMLLKFNGSGSASGLEFTTSYTHTADLKYRKIIDGNRVSGAWITLITTSNYTSYVYSKTSSDQKYLPFTGGTLTGALTVPSLNVTGAASFTSSINGNILGNAATASRLQNARTISLTGAVTGSGSFDGSGDLSIATTANHNHNSLYLTAVEFFAGESFATSPTESLTNGNVYLNATQTKNGTVTNVGSINIKGTGSVTVTQNSDGDILVNGTTYTNNVTSHLRLGSSGGTSNATSNVSNPYLLLVEGSSYDSQVLLKAGTGISVTGVNGIVTITNTIEYSDTKVTLTSTTTSSAYELLFSATADDTTRTEGARKTARLKYNPGTYEFTNGNCILQYNATTKSLDFYFT